MNTQGIRPAEIVPSDSRYVPLQQQPYLCCPTSIQIVMLRHNMPLVPAELIGHHMGLVVRPEDAYYFYNARTDENPPNGYGTHIGEDGIDGNAVFEKLGIPLAMEIIPVGEIKNEAHLCTLLSGIIKRDDDALLCLRWSNVLEIDTYAEPIEPTAGHIVVVDRVDQEWIRIVDAARGQKWKEYTSAHIYKALKDYEGEAGAGIWILKNKEKKNV